MYIYDTRGFMNLEISAMTLVRLRVKEILAQRETTLRKLCLAAGVSYEAVRVMLMRDNPSLSKLVRLAYVLDVPVADLLEED